MKRVVLALALCLPLAALAESAKGAPQGDVFVHGDAAAGEAKAAPCGACHGPAGNSANPEWPKLAGQGSRYVYEQLKAFKAGTACGALAADAPKPKDCEVTRSNPVMSPMAAPLSDEDMRHLAAYFARQPAAPGVASKDAVAIAGKVYRGGAADRGIPACMACHGPSGAGNPGSAYPRVGGQHATYAANRLRAYRTAAAGPLPDGNFQIMATVAAKLSDQEIDALASYLNGLQ